MKLLEPIRIGNLEVRNRVVMAPMTNNYARDGYVTERMVHFYEARARGGVGLVTVEDGIVDFPVGNNADNPVAIDDDKYIPMLRQLSAAIKKHGARAAIQLSHAGRRAGRLSRQTGCLEVTRGRLPVAPSILAHPSPGHVVPRELSVEEIEEIVEKFGQAARRAAEAGFDVISIHCAHMYLCGQFLSPWANRRTDQYGGSLENRLRFVLQVIKRIKRAVGSDFPLMCRMNGAEPEGGNTLEEIREIARRLEAAGIRAISVSVGFGAVLYERGFIPAEAPIGMPEGVIVHLAENIKAGVSVPVIAGNKIRSPAFAERILREDRADMIFLARPLIADPEWVKKVEEGRYGDIRPCVSCCQGCVEHVLKGIGITCILNPLAGREGEVAVEPVPSGQQKRVLVIGGGPAGLKAAITAASRGHQVTLWEKEDEVGGNVRLAAKPPHKEEMKAIIQYLERRARQVGVRVETGREVTAEMVRDFAPDAVVLATGSKSIRPDLPGIDGENVVMAADLLKYDRETGPRVAIIGGGQVGVEVAALLAEKGKAVTVIELLDEVARDMAILPKVRLIIELRDRGVRILTNARPREIRWPGVVVERNGRQEFVEADTVVIAVGARAENHLEEQLRGHVPALYVVGDCKSPRKIPEAVREGFEAGLQI